MLWAALSYAGGIVTGFYVWRPPVWWLVAAFGFCASGAYFLRHRALAAFALGLSALFVTASLMMQVRVPQSHGQDILAFADGRDLIITAHVIKEGNLREKTPGDAQQRLDVETEQIDTESETLVIHSGLRVNIYGRHRKNEDEANEGQESGDTPVHVFRYGERLRFPVRLYPPRNFRNPGAFDYA